MKKVDTNFLKPKKADLGKPESAHPLYDHDMQLFLSGRFGAVSDYIEFIKQTQKLQTTRKTSILTH